MEESKWWPPAVVRQGRGLPCMDEGAGVESDQKEKVIPDKPEGCW